jgi:hypothetical protein
MIWASIWSGLKGVPKWIWYGLLILMGLYALRADARRGGRRDEELKQERQEAVIRREAEAHVREVVTEERKRADDARETVGIGRIPSSDGMSDEEFRLFFGYDRTPREVDY